MSDKRTLKPGSTCLNSLILYGTVLLLLTTNKLFNYFYLNKAEIEYKYYTKKNVMKFRNVAMVTNWNELRQNISKNKLNLNIYIYFYYQKDITKLLKLKY